MTKKTDTKSSSQRSGNRGPILFIVLCLLFFGLRELFLFRLDSAHLVILEAKVTDKYIERRPHGAHQRHYTLVYTYHIGDKEYSDDGIVLPGKEDIWRQVKIGDCVEVKVNTKRPEQTRWNSNRPSFRCQTCE